MATATYLKGEKTTIEYTATGAVAIDQVVVCGAGAGKAASVAIAQGTATGAGVTVIMDIAGCYTMTKATGAAIKAGDTVDWDISATLVDDNAATSAAGDVPDFGAALADAGTGTSTVPVKLLPGNGVVST